MAVYYVKAGGSDAADGLSDATAWATVGHAANFAFAPGDSLLFRGGDTFSDAMLYLSNLASGTAANPITVGSYGTGKATLAYSPVTQAPIIGAAPGKHYLVIQDLILDPARVYTNDPVEIVGIQNDSGTGNTNWTIQRCDFSRLSGHGIQMTNFADFGWVIDSCTFTNIGSHGVVSGAEGATLNPVEIKDCTFTGVGLNTALADGKHGIYIRFPGPQVHGCTFTNIPNGQAVSFRAHGFNIYDNEIHDTGGGAFGFFDYDLAAPPQGVSYIHSNKCWNLTGYALYYDSQLDPNGQNPSVDLVVANNTFEFSSAVVIGIDLSNAMHANITFKNNNVVGFAGMIYGIKGPISAMDPGKSFVCDYNNWEGFSASQWSWQNNPTTFAQWQADGFDTHGLNAASLISAGPDLQPPTSSPVLNAGTTSVSGLVYMRLDVATAPSATHLYYVGNAPQIGAVGPMSQTVREVFSDGLVREVPQPASQPGDTFPAGVIQMWAGPNPPAGWLFCDGSAVSRGTYPTLFSNIGTTWGAGDGSTTFNLPNFHDAMPIGAGNLYALASSGGESTHALTTAEMPSHSHGGVTQNNSASVSGSTDTQGNHTHVSRLGNGFMTPASGGDVASWHWGTASSTAYSDNSTNTAGAHSHNVSGTAASHGHAINAEGGGAAHNNLPPYKGVHYIIRAY